MTTGPTPIFRQARVCECGDHGFVGLADGRRVALFSPAKIAVVAGVLWCCGTSTRYAYAYSRRVGWMHRALAGTNESPNVDHVNGDGLDNRDENLRPCNPSQNQWNRRRSRHSKNAYKGIYQLKDGRFLARIRTNGQRIELGRFATAEDAALAYDEAAIARCGEFAATNASLGLLSADTSGAFSRNQAPSDARGVCREGAL